MILLGPISGFSLWSDFCGSIFFSRHNLVPVYVEIAARRNLQKLPCASRRQRLGNESSQQLAGRQDPGAWKKHKHSILEETQENLANMALFEEQTIVIAVDASNFAEHAVTCKFVTWNKGFQNVGIFQFWALLFTCWCGMTCWFSCWSSWLLTYSLSLLQDRACPSQNPVSVEKIMSV